MLGSAHMFTKYGGKNGGVTPTNEGGKNGGKNGGVTDGSIHSPNSALHTSPHCEHWLEVNRLVSAQIFTNEGGKNGGVTPGLQLCGVV